MIHVARIQNVPKLVRFSGHIAVQLQRRNTARRGLGVLT